MQHVEDLLHDLFARVASHRLNEVMLLETQGLNLDKGLLPVRDSLLGHNQGSDSINQGHSANSESVVDLALLEDVVG